MPQVVRPAPKHMAAASGLHGRTAQRKPVAEHAVQPSSQRMHTMAIVHSFL